MKVFKAACVFAAVFFNLIFFPLFPQNAAVAERYAYAYVDIDSTVYFCSEKNSDKALFEVPKTYCLEILGEEDGWLKVSYAKDEGIYKPIEGFCLQDGLILSDEAPKTPYLNRTVTVPFRPEEVGNLLIPLDPIEAEAAYYGGITIMGKTYSYVLCNGYFGHITGAIENYPLNTLPSQSAFSPAQATQNTADKSTFFVALAITAVAIIAITVLYLSGKKPPKQLS